MRTRNHQNQFFMENAKRIINELKEASKDNIQALARFSIWNSVFIDEPIIPDTKIRTHFNNIIRRHLIGSTSPQRFLFELSVFMIDLPNLYLKLIDMFPIPYSVAGRIAFRAVSEKIDATPADATEQLKVIVSRYLPNPPPQISQIIEAKTNRVTTFESYINQLLPLIPREVLEGIIRTFPPKQRMKYSIKYGCTPPKLDLNLSNISLPYEFLQAIADIDGIEMANTLIEDDEDE